MWDRPAWCIAGVLLLFAVPQASAQSLWPSTTSQVVPGQLFVSVGAQVGVYNLPKFDSPWKSAKLDPGPVANDLVRPSIDPDPTVVGPNGEFGYAFRKGAFPAWMGSKVRLSLGAQFLQGSFSDSDHRGVGAFTGVPSAYYSAAPIDGSLGTTIGVLANRTTRDTSFDVDTNGYQLSLRLASDFAAAPRLTLSPFVAVFGGQARQSYTVRARVSGTISDIGIYALDERISTARVGAMLGTGVTYRVSRRVSVHFGAQAGLVWLRSHMTGGDCFRGTPAAAVGTACAAATSGAGSFQTSVSDTRSTVGFRGGLTTGVTLSLGPATLSVNGFMTYDSQVPAIRNPQVTSPITTTGNNNQPTSGRAHLFFDGALNFGGMVFLRIPFNAPDG